MKILSKYILKKCLLNTTMLLFAFAVIYTIVTAIPELGDVGKGNYTTLSMFVYLGALLPGYIYLLTPLAVLIGVMTTMLGLVKNSEYAIMRTSGVSLKDITHVLAIFGIFFTFVTFALGEVIAPSASHFAKLYKLNKLNQQVSTELSSGVWSKDGEHSIINIKQINQNDSQQITGVQIFNFTEDQQLQRYITATSGHYNSNEHAWELESVTIYKYLGYKISIVKPENYSWPSTIDPSYFSVLVVSPEDMPALGLIQYIKHLKTNNQATNRHEIALWSKLLYPIACISMAFIAIGFIPNNGRNINLSAKLFVGILIGITFFFSNKLIGYMAVLFDWNAILSATIPTVILFAAGWIVILKKEA
ncbi:MAG: LPS export ABC transporter permease LptG [Neisseriales bacterium]|nr:MAG: LPS export ABC transporter permease LptG [Neisseriales bacterium]HRG63875.1 LPS export ABC transporter permease LptG [Burkholderiales bacterium]